MASAMSVQRAHVQALPVDREALAGYQGDNDALVTRATLEAAYRTDAEPKRAPVAGTASSSAIGVPVNRASRQRPHVGASASRDGARG